MSAHALLGGSNALRWLVCTPSARLEAKFPDHSGESAKEGTFAHELADLYLSERQGSPVTLKATRLKAGSTEYGNFYSQDMEENVEAYVDLLDAKYQQALKADKNAVLLHEEKLDFSSWVPHGFGRGDAIIIADGVMEVIDFKYGATVSVTAKNNPQMRLYALGAYNAYGWLYDIDCVQMTIFQPRNGGEKAETITTKELLSWGETIKPIAAQAYKGDGELSPGEHCRFCRASPRCRALKEHNLQLAADYDADADPRLLSDKEIADVLSRIETLTAWANKVKAYAQEEAVDNGRVFPGYKLVAGRSVRKIGDAAKAETLLEEAGYKKADILKTELLTISKLEKLVGKKKLAELLNEVIVKPPGKPTLVPDSDPRPAFNSAANDFDVIPDDVVIPF